MEKGIYLQHGTLIYEIDLDAMPEALNLSEGIVNERVTSILKHKKLSQDDVYDALKNNFTKNKEIKTEELLKYETMRAEDLAKTKYNHITLPSGTLLKNKGACYVERGG